MSSPTMWYVARSSGIVAWFLLAAAFVWGVLLAGRLLGTRPKPAWMLDLHRWLGGLAVTFTGVHVLGLVADTYVHFGWVEVLVPFGSSWKPWQTAAGVVALWLLVAVEATSLLMRRLGRRSWRRVHLTSFGLFWMATLHGITAGTDAGNPALRIGMLGSVTVAVVAVGHRVLTAGRPVRPRRPIGAAATSHRSGAGMVEVRGIEPLASSMRPRRSTN